MQRMELEAEREREEKTLETLLLFSLFHVCMSRLSGISLMESLRDVSLFIQTTIRGGGKDRKGLCYDRRHMRVRVRERKRRTG